MLPTELAAAARRNLVLLAAGMALIGAALVDHGHSHGAVFPVLSATLIGLSDLLGDVTGAGLVVVGGFALEVLGLAAVCVGAPRYRWRRRWSVREPSPAGAV